MARPRSANLPEASPYGSHLPALDGLRGMAVMAVICSHLFPGTARGPLTGAVRFVFALGATGVDLFFVLSGFLITGILVDSLGDPHFFQKFYARRVLRIFPLYYAVLGFYALGALFFGMRYGGQLWSMALYLQNTSLVARPICAYAGPSLLPLPHFWSLAVEEQFYLVWPLVVFLLRRRTRLLAVCLGFAVLCPVLRAMLWSHGWAYYPVHTNTFLRADSLLAGAALALLLRSDLHLAALHWARFLAGAGALLVAATFANESLFHAGPAWWPPVQLSLRYSALDLLFVGMLGMALQPRTFSGVCRLRVLRFLGRYSYGLYVFHYLLFPYMQAPLRELIAAHLTANKGVGIALTGMLCFGISVVVAVLSFQLFERRFLSLKRFFSYRKPEPEQLDTELPLAA